MQTLKLNCLKTKKVVNETVRNFRLYTCKTLQVLY